MSKENQTLGKLKGDAESFRSQLPQSSSKDEALQLAIKAAETSVQAMKLATDPAEKESLSTRFKQLLTEAEQIKTSDDWRQVVESHEKRPAAPPTTARVLKEPTSTRKLSKQEQILVLKASYLSGFKFPPWSEAPKAEEFELNDGEELFLYVYTASYKSDCSS